MKIYLLLKLTQEPLVEDVAGRATVDVEPVHLAGGEVDFVDVFGISYFDVGFEEFVLGVEVIGKGLEGGYARWRTIGNGGVGDGMEDALQFATDSMEVAIVMVIYTEAMSFGITEDYVCSG